MSNRPAGGTHTPSSAGLVQFGVATTTSYSESACQSPSTASFVATSLTLSFRVDSGITWAAFSVVRLCLLSNLASNQSAWCDNKHSRASKDKGGHQENGRLP